MKQAIVVRTDLDLSPGKLAAQVAHASVYAADRADEGVYEAWLESPAKIVLAGEDESHLRRLRDRATAEGLPVSLVSDAGRTEVNAGTTTALAVGPASSDAVDSITGDLALYPTEIE